MDNVWAIVNDESDIIVNSCVWDGVANWSPPPGHSVYRAWPVYIGWLWNNGEQIDPNPPLPAPSDGE